jgi:hypothetical protein
MSAIGALAQTGLMTKPPCEYQGNSPPDAVKKDVGKDARDQYYFTTFSDVEDVPGSSLHEQVNLVFNRSPKFLLPFEWLAADLAFRDLATDDCAYNSLTTGKKFMEIQSKFSFGTKLHEHVESPLYGIVLENDKKASKTGRPRAPVKGSKTRLKESTSDTVSKVRLVSETIDDQLQTRPRLESRFSAASLEYRIDLKFVSDADKSTIGFGIANKSLIPLVISIPTLDKKIKSIKEGQGRAEYRLDRKVSRSETQYRIRPNTNEDDNRIIIHYSDPLSPTERIVKAQILDSGGQKIGTCRLSIYLPDAPDAAK